MDSKKWGRYSRMGYILPIQTHSLQYLNRGIKIQQKDIYVNRAKEIQNDLQFRDQTYYTGHDTRMKNVLKQLPTENGKGSFIDIYI
jgi:hypothetical protein